MENPCKNFAVILIVLMLFSSQMLVGQSAPASSSGSISGKIFDDSGKTPVEYANIVLYKASDSSMVNGCISKKDGTFQLTRIPEGKYYISVDFVGFKKQFISEIEISPSKRNIELQNIFLSTSNTSLSEIEVVSNTKKVEYQIDKIVVNVSQNVLSSGGTASDILRNTPGVQVDPQGNITIKGSSSFTVLIDGKPTILQGNEALKQIPASQIKNIEIITNPSAKYDPDGVSGIVNLILKKQNLNGFNGNITLNCFLPKFLYGDAMFNYRKDKINFFFGFYSNQRPYPASSVLEGTYVHGDTTRLMESDTKREVRNQTMNFKAGFDYYINKKNTLSIGGEIGNWSHRRIFQTKSSYYFKPDWYENYDIIDDEFSIHRNYFVFTSSYQHLYSKPGKSLLISFIASAGEGPSKNLNETSTADKDFNPIIGSTNKTRFSINDPRKLFRFKADYTLPIGSKYKLESGIKADANFTSSDYFYERYNTALLIWEKDNHFSNVFDYHQYIFAAYSTFSGSIKKFEYLLGLREEYTERLFDQKTTNVKYPWTDLNLFPTLHISRPIGKKSELQMSYSRRINRPGERSLNPYPDYTDKYYVNIGNPMLEPEFINSYEVNFLREMKKWNFSAETFYRNTNNAIDQVLWLSKGDTMITTAYNFGRTFELGTNVSANLNFVKNLTIIPTVTWYINYLNGKTYNQENFTYNEPQWNSSVTCQYAYKKRTNIQLTFVYLGPRNTPNAKVDPMYQVSTALRHTFKNEKMWISIQAQDFMSFTKYITYNYYQGSQFRNVYDPKPTIVVSFTYRINRYMQRRQTDLNGIIDS